MSFEWRNNHSILFHNHKNKNSGLKTSFFSNFETGLKPVLFIIEFHVFTFLNKFQLCFQKLYNAASNLESAKSWLSQYDVVNDSLKEAFCIGDAKKNAQRIDTDFYLSAFHPVQSLNLENIFYDFPRLSQILASDCIPVEVIFKIELMKVIKISP